MLRINVRAYAANVTLSAAVAIKVGQYLNSGNIRGVPHTPASVDNHQVNIAIIYRTLTFTPLKLHCTSNVKASQLYNIVYI